MTWKPGACAWTRVCRHPGPLAAMLLWCLLVALPSPANAAAWVVAADGSGDFRSVQAAIDAVPAHGSGPQVIRVRAGLYREVVRVPVGKNGIRLVGAGSGATVISWDNFATRIDPATGQPFRTSGSATFFVDGDDFIASDLTIANTAGPVGQALALSVRGPRAGFRSVRLLGHQDTLYVHEGSRVHIKDSYIEGTVDFIFGGATALFDDCVLFAKGPSGYITAASTPQGQAHGLVFRRAIVRGERPGVTFLGRPWRPYARTVFLDSDLGETVAAAGWHDWNKPDAHTTSFYAEHANTGPGAAPTRRVPWAHQLDGARAAGYTTSAILGDWQPFAGP